MNRNDGACSESKAASLFRTQVLAPRHKLVGDVVLLSELRPRLKVIALMCLLATAILGWAVAHGRSPYGFEKPVLAWLGPPSANSSWADLAERLAAPVIGAVLVVSFVLGFVKQAFFRVVVYTALAASALLISENVVKPLVHRTYQGELTFPSGHVTAVSATALAMWLALYPLLGTRMRNITLVLGVAWILSISLAVVGAYWHTPLDTIGSILLSAGIVTGGAAVFEPAGTRAPFMDPRRARTAERGGG